MKGLKRFLIKTGVFPNEALLVSIIRRIDLDADAKLNFKEFAEFVIPIENYSKRSIKEKNNISLSPAKSMRSSSKQNLHSSKKSL